MKNESIKLDNDFVDSNPRHLSRYFYDLINKLYGQDVKKNGEHIPKKIVQYWDDEQMIPEDVTRCMNTWKDLETKGFKHFVFNSKTAFDFIEKYYPKEYVDAFTLCPHPAMRADLFRLCYLLEYGGIYVDADDVLIDNNIDDRKR